MSSKSHRTRLLAIAGAATAFATLGTSSAQAAQTAQLDYKCKFPLLGTITVRLNTTIDLPDTWPGQERTQQWPVSGKVTLGYQLNLMNTFFDDFGSLQLISDAQRGSALLTSIRSSVEPDLDVRVPISSPAVTPNPVTNATQLELPYSGAFPSLPGFVGTADRQVALTDLTLNFRALTFDGTPVDGLVTPPTDIDRRPYLDVDGNPETFNIPCKLDPAAQNTNIASFVVSDDDWDQPPTKPGQSSEYVPGDITCNAVRLRWTPSFDDVLTGPVEYRVRYEGGPDGGLRVPAPATDVIVENLAPDTEYDFLISAVDNAGQEGEALQQTFRTLLPPPSAPGSPEPCTGVPPQEPTPPGAPVPSETTQTSVKLTWTPAEDVDGEIVGYEVYDGTTKVAESATTSATVTGLTAGSTYTFYVVAIDDDGLRTPGPEAIIKTPTNPLPPPTIKYSYALAGSTQLRTLTKGTLPLRGAINAELTIASGAFTADLTLADTSGRLVAAGFLPVTAKIGFVPSGKTVGTLSDGVLKSSSKVRIKVKEVKLFGAIPLAGGNTCQTRQLSDINLQSTQDEFKPLEGGPIAGTYKISDLNGCGPLGGLVSPLTAGGGNTINLNLTPVAPAAS